jgi:hypothetical protein|nr:MAG TPA: hypothetical protein [Caudoviricetes sp.]
MTLNELFNINYAWTTRTELTIIYNTAEKMVAYEAKRKYGDYTVDFINGDRVCVSKPEEY